MKKLIAMLLTVLIVQTPLLAQNADRDIKGMVDYFERLQKELARAETEDTRQKILKSARKRALSMIDTELIARLSLGNHYERLTEDQQEEFIDSFNALFAHHIVETHIPTEKIVANPVKVTVLSRMKRYDPYFFQQAEVVKVSVTKGKAVYRASFYMVKHWSGYKIYDIHLDGASLLMDYRLQFQSIIQEKGFDYLLEKLRGRLQEFHDNGK